MGQRHAHAHPLPPTLANTETHTPPSAHPTRTRKVVRVGQPVRVLASLRGCTLEAQVEGHPKGKVAALTREQAKRLSGERARALWDKAQELEQQAVGASLCSFVVRVGCIGEDRRGEKLGGCGAVHRPKGVLADTVLLAGAGSSNPMRILFFCRPCTHTHERAITTPPPLHHHPKNKHVIRKTRSCERPTSSRRPASAPATPGCRCAGNED